MRKVLYLGVSKKAKGIKVRIWRMLWDILNYIKRHYVHLVSENVDLQYLKKG